MDEIKKVAMKNIWLKQELRRLKKEIVFMQEKAKAISDFAVKIDTPEHTGWYVVLNVPDDCGEPEFIGFCNPDIFETDEIIEKGNLIIPVSDPKTEKEFLGF